MMDTLLLKHWHPLPREEVETLLQSGDKVPADLRLFATAPIGITECAWILTGGIIIYIVVGSEKWLHRRAGSKKADK